MLLYYDDGEKRLQAAVLKSNYCEVNIFSQSGDRWWKLYYNVCAGR